VGHRVSEIYTLKMRSSRAVLGSSGVTEERLWFVVCMIKPGDMRRTWQDRAILYGRSGKEDSIALVGPACIITTMGMIPVVLSPT
jgi:hypothetical protein